MQTTTVAIKTFGCRLNQAETARIRADLEGAGFKIVPFKQKAEIYLIHGCVITAKAEKECLHLARAIRRRHPTAYIVLAGCVAQIKKGDGPQKLGVDLLADQTEKYQLSQLLRQRGFGGTATQSPAPPVFESTRAMVKVQDGCEFCCAYCIVPHARGATRSRPLTEIVAEVQSLVSGGHREIVVTGANLGCYVDHGRRLPELLTELEAIPELERMRVSSLELSTVEKSVIDFMADSKKLCRFLHLPLQSGSDRILAAMGRRYTARQYQEVIQYAVKRLGNPGLGTDVMVGFPEETDDDFTATVALIDKLPFNNLHVFAYSPRPGTRAANFPGQISAQEKQRRTKLLLDVGRQKRLQFAQQWVGREITVLIETVNTQGLGQGWSGEYLPAKVSGKNIQPNTILRLIPNALDGHTLRCYL